MGDSDQAAQLVQAMAGFGGGGAGENLNTVPLSADTSQQPSAAFAGHSLRAGFVTSAVKRGANLIKMTDVTGHCSLEMLKIYSRDAEAFVRHAGAGLL